MAPLAAALLPDWITTWPEELELEEPDDRETLPL
jgi:hypothetical protein